MTFCKDTYHLWYNTCMIFLKKLPVINIFFDLLLMLIVLFFFDDLIAFHTNHLTLSYFLAYPIHLIAIATGLFMLMSAEGKPEKKETFTDKIIGGILGFGMVMVFFSFIWMLLPFLAIEKITGKPPFGRHYLLISMILFSLLSGAYGGSKGEEYNNKKIRIEIKLLAGFIIVFFLSYSETLLIASVQAAQLSPVQVIATVMWATFGYLPLRMMFYYQPPVNGLELLTMVAGYGILVYQLI